MCNDRGAEAVNMLKSATLFSSQPLMFHVFHADGNDKLVEMELATWPDVQVRPPPEKKIGIGREKS